MVDLVEPENLSVAVSDLESVLALVTALDHDGQFDALLVVVVVPALLLMLVQEGGSVLGVYLHLDDLLLVGLLGTELVLNGLVSQIGHFLIEDQESGMTGADFHGEGVGV